MTKKTQKHRDIGSKVRVKRTGQNFLKFGGVSILEEFQSWRSSEMHMRKSSSSRRRVGICLCPLISYTQNVLSKNNQTISAVRKTNIKTEVSK